MLTTLTEILSHKFVGNHASDRVAFDTIDKFILLPTTSQADRRAALRHMSIEGMGMGHDYTDDELDNHITAMLANKY